ncbi:MAG: hypothetical protein PVG93_04630 [Phycisphaerales bacterium]|jgi:hypothetical protein
MQAIKNIRLVALLAFLATYSALGNKVENNAIAEQLKEKERKQKSQIQLGIRLYKINQPYSEVINFLKDDVHVRFSPGGGPAMLTAVQAEIFESWAAGLGESMLVSPVVKLLDGKQATVNIGEQHKLITDYKKTPNDGYGPAYKDFMTGVKITVQADFEPVEDVVIAKLDLEKNELIRRKRHTEHGFVINKPLLETKTHSQQVKIPNGGYALVEVTDFSDSRDTTTLLLAETYVEFDRENPRYKVPNWGQDVNGLRCRLRAAKETWQFGEVPELLLDIENNMLSNRVEFVPVAAAHCEIEYDSKWYGWAEPLVIDAPIQILERGEKMINAIRIRLDSSWGLAKGDMEFAPGREENWGQRLEIIPGRHTVRVKFHPHQSSTKDGPLPTAISNTVEIEVLTIGQANKPQQQTQLRLKEAIDLEFSSDCALSEAIDKLRNSFEPALDIVVIWRDLERVGIERNTPVGIGPISNIPLKTALKLLIESVSGGYTEISYTILDGVIVIATERTLARLGPETRIHDIIDLAQLPAEYRQESN